MRLNKRLDCNNCRCMKICLILVDFWWLLKLPTPVMRIGWFTITFKYSLCFDWISLFHMMFPMNIFGESTESLIFLPLLTGRLNQKLPNSINIGNPWILSMIDVRFFLCPIFCVSVITIWNGLFQNLQRGCRPTWSPSSSKLLWAIHWSSHLIKFWLVYFITWLLGYFIGRCNELWCV